MIHAVKRSVFIFRLSFSKNGVVRIDGFSSPDQYDDEALSLWTHENYEDDELDLETSKYILDIIGDKFCQLVTSEKTAMSWVKKDGKEPSKLSRVLQFFLGDHCFLLCSSPPLAVGFSWAVW